MVPIRIWCQCGRLSVPAEDTSWTKLACTTSARIKNSGSSPRIMSSNMLKHTLQRRISIRSTINNKSTKHTSYIHLWFCRFHVFHSFDSKGMTMCGVHGARPKALCPYPERAGTAGGGFPQRRDCGTSKWAKKQPPTSLKSTGDTNLIGAAETIVPFWWTSCVSTNLLGDYCCDSMIREQINIYFATFSGGESP